MQWCMIHVQSRSGIILPHTIDHRHGHLCYIDVGIAIGCNIEFDIDATMTMTVTCVVLCVCVFVYCMCVNDKATAIWAQMLTSRFDIAI